MIPGAETVHAREVWQSPLYPVTGPVDDPRNNDTVVIHYTAADDLIDGDPGEHASNLPAYIRAMQKSYVDNRGYSLGYLFAVDWLGGIWQIRGWEFQSAANAGHNGHTWPILVLVDGDDAATDEAAASIRLIVAEAERRASQPQAIKGHGQLRRETGVGTATACCGAGLQAQVNARHFAPLAATEPQPPTQGDIDMIRLSFAQANQPTTEMVWTGTELAWVENGHAANVLVTAGVASVSTDRATVQGVILASRTTTRAPYTLDAELAQLWDTRAA